jgi:CheY-like chemotaxis protein
MDSAVEAERLDAIRREVARIAEVVERLGEIAAGETYATVDYVGPVKMVDLRKRPTGAPEPEPALRGARILVVDDDLGIRQSLAELLAREGCDVATAGDGAEALDVLAKSRFDLVLSDVVMPRMDGYELFITVRQRHPELPILMMTAFHYDRDHVIKRSRMEGLDGVIFKKPVDPVRLREALVDALGQQQPEVPRPK